MVATPLPIKGQVRLRAPRAVTFKDAATACIAARRAEWRSAKTAYIWEHTLKAYAFSIMVACPSRRSNCSMSKTRWRRSA